MLSDTVWQRLLIALTFALVILGGILVTIICILVIWPSMPICWIVTGDKDWLADRFLSLITRRL